jgi:cytochrome b6-f complex iron-sulfur subunit
VSTNPTSTKAPTRRTFLGWWIASLLTATVITVLAPLGVYVFPPFRPNLRAGKIRVALNTPLADIAEGAAVRFDSPAGMSFTMADGGEANTAGDPTYGGYLARDKGTLRAFAITCPHLGCSYNYDEGLRHFLCPCHGSQFALDGSIVHGPATAPLSHLTWQPGAAVDEIEIEGATQSN